MEGPGYKSFRLAYGPEKPNSVYYTTGVSRSKQVNKKLQNSAEYAAVKLDTEYGDQL